MKNARMKFQAALLSAIFLALLLGGCDKQSPIGQLAQDTKSSAEKAKDAVKDATTKTADAVKNTTQKAVDAGKSGYQKAATFGTNAVRKTTSLATNVAAHARAGAQKVESVTTNIVSDIERSFN